MIVSPQNGFLSVLGSFPVHFAMLLTMLGTVDVPRDDSGEVEEKYQNIYT